MNLLQLASLRILLRCACQVSSTPSCRVVQRRRMAARRDDCPCCCPPATLVQGRMRSDTSRLHPTRSRLASTSAVRAHRRKANRSQDMRKATCATVESMSPRPRSLLCASRTANLERMPHGKCFAPQIATVDTSGYYTPRTSKRAPFWLSFRRSLLLVLCEVSTRTFRDIRRL